MYEVSIEELKQLLTEARNAAKYAREHYSELSSRSCAYTLYGADAYGIGAYVPSSMVPKSARKLLLSTRRKNYIRYDLNDQYRAVRTVHMLEYSKVDCVFYHFEMNGTCYAYPFRGNTGKIYNDAVYALKYDEKKPVSYMVAYPNFLFAQFYEYTDSGTMLVSTYRYWPTMETSLEGSRIDPAAPIGTPNSSVQRHCVEESPAYIDFSVWFE